MCVHVCACGDGGSSVRLCIHHVHICVCVCVHVCPLPSIVRLPYLEGGAEAADEPHHAEEEEDARGDLEVGRGVCVEVEVCMWGGGGRCVCVGVCVCRCRSEGTYVIG